MSTVETGNRNKKRVLVVDDELSILRFVKTSLSLAGYDALTASSGEEALRLTRTENPDIVILDIFMPSMSGYEVLREMRKFTDVPVVIFSASRSAYEKAMEYGADGFISKPFKPADLARKIEGILKGRKK